MKNLLKIAVVALALSCFQAYSRDYGENFEYLTYDDCEHSSVCTRLDAACHVKIMYGAEGMIRIRTYTRYPFLVYMVHFSDRNGYNRKIKIPRDHCIDLGH